MDAMPPGLAGYLQAQQGNQQLGMQNMQMAQLAQNFAAQADAQRKKQAYDTAMSQLGPDATPEDRLKAAMPFMGPDAQAKLVSDAENRKAQREQMAQQYADRLQAGRDALEEKKRQFDARASSEEEKRQFQQQYLTDKANNDRMMQGLMFQLKQQGLQLASDKADQGKAAGLQKQTQGLGTALERANLPEADATLKGVEEALKKTPNLAEYLSGPKSLLPDAVVPDDIKAGRQAFQKMFNITLKNRSGAAVTNQEMDRLKAEFGAGAFKTQDQLKAAIDQARNIFGQHYRSVAAGFGPEVLNAYNENLRQTGGTPLLEPIGTPTTPSSGSIKRLKFDANGNPVP